MVTSRGLLRAFEPDAGGFVLWKEVLDPQIGYLRVIAFVALIVAALSTAQWIGLQATKSGSVAQF